MVKPEFWGIGITYVLGDAPDIETNADLTEVNQSKHWVQEEYSTNNLTRMQNYVTQNSGTEPAFNNEYYDHDKEGIYVDVVSREPLFSSEEKFDSGTGWPHFYEPLEPDNIE